MRKNIISRCIALAGGALLSTALMAKPPNILVIMSDDVGLPTSVRIAMA